MKREQSFFCLLIAVLCVGCSSAPESHEIWYYTSDGKTIEIHHPICSAHIISNAYEHGKGIIRFDNAVMEISPNSFQPKNIGFIFTRYAESTLTKIILPESVQSIGNYAFAGCSKLKSFVLPPNVTSIGNDAFAHCDSLESINLQNVTSIGNDAFAHCNSLESINLQNVTSIGNDVFAHCNSLESINLQNVTSIGNDAFAYCNSLESIILSECLVSIGNRAFYECHSLLSVILPYGLKIIGKYAFWKGPVEVFVPSSVESIGTSAFSGNVFIDSESSLKLEGAHSYQVQFIPHLEYQETVDRLSHLNHR